MERVRSYCKNSSIHGLHYITDQKRHWTERVFWCFLWIGAIIGWIQLNKLTMYAFLNNAVSFTVETTYIEWETTFPAVSVCEHDSPDKIYHLGNKLFGEDRNMNMDFYIRDIAFFDGTCYSCKTHCNNTITCTNNLTYVIEKVRSKCDKLLGECKWNNDPFDCCSNFLPLETEIGTCFTVNSLHAKRFSKMSQKFLSSNQVAGPGLLSFKAFEAVKVLIHGPEDVPYINHPQEEKGFVTWGHTFKITFKVKEIENDPEVITEISLEQRNCRFPEENTLSLYSLYSYSACVVECRAKAQLKFCGCVHHFISKLSKAKECDIQGLICLTNYSEYLRVLKAPDADKQGIVCDCMSSCREPEYTVISKENVQNENYDEAEHGSEVHIQMESLPNERFKRNVVRTHLDLLVSIGGAAGLFLGASLLSTFECIYYFCIRKPSAKKSDEQEHSTENKLRLNSRKEILKYRITQVEEYQNKIYYQENDNAQVVLRIPFLK